MAGASPETETVSDAPGVAATSAEAAARVSNPSAETSSRSVADSEPAPNDAKFAVAAIDLQPRQANVAVPVAGAGSSVVKETSAEVPVSFWSFTAVACAK